VFSTTADGASSPTERLRIENNGSATFTSPVTFGPYNISDANGTGVSANSGGVVRVQRGSSATTAEVWQGYLGTTKTSEIKANGSVEFDFQTTTGTNAGLTLNSTLSGSNQRTFYHDANGTTVLTPRSGIPALNCNGSATFSSSVSIGGTAAANTIDEYEEGTWTPRLTGTSGGNYTPGSDNYGKYTRVGDLVTVSCTLHWSARVTAYAGLLAITGLPYTSSSSGARNCGIIGAVQSGITYPSGYNRLTIAHDPGQNLAYIITNSSTGSGYTHSPTVGSTGRIYTISWFYHAS